MRAYDIGKKSGNVYALSEPLEQLELQEALATLLNHPPGAGAIISSQHAHSKRITAAPTLDACPHHDFEAPCATSGVTLLEHPSNLLSERPALPA